MAWVPGEEEEDASEEQGTDSCGEDLEELESIHQCEDLQVL
jgi:hypothetical protein